MWGLVGGALGEAANVTTGTTTLFRAVGSSEMSDLEATGVFRPSPTNSDMKGFFFSQSDAQKFANMTSVFDNPSHTIVSTEAPTDLVNSSSAHVADQEGPGVYIRNPDLPQLGAPSLVDPQ
jgi:hypothetical protein